MRANLTDEEYSKLPISTRHTAFHKKQPTNPDTKVWRFLNLFKYLYLLEHQQLRFSRIDAFSDPYEGAMPISHQGEFLNDNDRTMIDARIERMIDEKKNIFASCWYLDNEESDAMWNLYCGRDDGVAIQTTYKHLQEYAESLTQEEHVRQFFIGKIEYIDYGLQSFPSTNGFEYFMHKRRSFLHEKEVRILTGMQTIDGEPKEGLSVPFNVNKIIQKVFVHPLAKQDYYQLVKSVTARYFTNLEVAWSSMREEKGIARTNKMKFSIG